jgi:hypothetical protein
MENILTNTYLIGTAPSWLLAFAIGRWRGVNGVKLLFGAVMLALSWPLWAAGGLALTVLGLALAVVGTVALALFVAFCAIAAFWVILLLKCVEVLGWFHEKPTTG